MLKAIVGLQFGDEGKGKFVDFFSQNYDHIVRFNGGPNAGHTVETNERREHFSQIPATFTGKNLYLASGTLVSLEKLLEEIELIKTINPDVNIIIDPRCHVILPIHLEYNKFSELYKGIDKIGSVGVGVGACVEDKVNRNGIRIWDLLDEDRLKKRIDFLLNFRKTQIKTVFNGNISDGYENILIEICEYGARIKPYLKFVNELIAEKLLNDENILLEGSQATFLDNTFGTYPYTVAYQTLISTCFSSIGIPCSTINIVGVLKSYTIRVGNGPLPTEQDNDIGEALRIHGNEYGTVSKRKRRCGWLDLVLAKQAVKLNGINSICLTNVDVLSCVETIKVAVSYTIEGKSVNPNEALLSLESVVPVYKDFPSWRKLDSVYDCYDDLPEACKTYIGYIEKELGVPIEYISYGPKRHQTLKK